MHNKCNKSWKGVKYLTMTEQAKEQRRMYKRAWAKRNPEKIKEYHRRFWEKKAAAEGAGSEEKVPEENAAF